MDVPTHESRVFPEARAYQTDGAAFILRAFANALSPKGQNCQKSNEADNKAGMLADDPGVGKTLQALMIAYGLDARRVLTVAPLMARASWPVLIEKHAPTWSEALRTPRFSDEPGEWVFDERVFALLTYDMFSVRSAARRWLPALTRKRWDLLILDECHYLKNADSGRTRNIYGAMDGRHRNHGLQGAADRVLLLSGTPCPNNAAELFPHFHTFWHHILHTPQGKVLSRYDFEERFTRYTDGPWGRQFHGSKSQEQLREALAPVILRRRRNDVLRELPPLTVQDVPLGLDSGPMLVPPELRDEYDRLQALSDEELPDALSANFIALSSIRRVLGMAKVGATALWVHERMTTGVNKMLLFAWHTDVIRELTGLLDEFLPVVVTGASTGEARAEAVARFQREPGVRLFIGQTRAAGTSVTLTAADEVAIVEPSWTPSDNEQVIARAWRMGQTRPVLASFLYLPGSLDERVMTTFRRKAAELTHLYRTETTTEHEPGSYTSSCLSD